jgi:hypothetical protein
VQEIFQAVTVNFYAADASLVTPLILVGREYWTAVYPAWPLLQRLGADRPMGEVIHCVDDVKEAVDIFDRTGVTKRRHCQAPARFRSAC